MLTFEDTDICRITNYGNQEVTIGWNSRSWKIKPSEVAVVPVNAAILAFGDPRAIDDIRSWKSPITNEVGWIPDRAAEIRRLRCKYAILTGDDTSFQDDSGSVPEQVPNISMEVMDGGDFVPVSTVLSDPRGHDSVLDETSAVDIQTLKASLEKTQRQLAILMAKNDNDIGFADEDTIPMDDPKGAILDSPAEDVTVKATSRK